MRAVTVVLCVKRFNSISASQYSEGPNRRLNSVVNRPQSVNLQVACINWNHCSAGPVKWREATTCRCGSGIC
uniref:Uncharacterized protein n=1 Tax=Kalanchoe fedtschenkoi TaxID=63787 RepID=A0A7N1A1U9_KALFE